MANPVNLAYLHGCRPYEPNADSARKVQLASAGGTPKTRITFGFQGGDTAETVARRKRYMLEAQKQWPFLSELELSRIRNDVQLTSKIADCSGVSLERATSDVQIWMEGKQF